MKRLFSIVLTLVMILTVATMFPDTANAKDYGSTKFNPAELTTGDTFTMGMYPQGKVTSSSTIAALNEIECTMTNYGYMKNSDAQTHTYEATDISYADMEYNGARYRKVLFNETRPAYPYLQNSSSAGNHEVNDLPANTVYYFKWEPIVWKVLANESDGVYVTSQKLLDSQPYHDYDEEKPWETCSLRTWLNEDFYNSAFSSAEKAKMISAENIGSVPDSDITDHIWLLSYADTYNADYGFSTQTGGGWYAHDEARRVRVTDYAKYQGAELDYDMVRGSWWVRSHTTGTIYNTVCLDSGGYDLCRKAKTSVGVRPAFKLSKDVKHQITFDPNGGTGTIDPVEVEDGEEYTLPSNTFQKEGRTAYGWKVGSEYKQAGDKITVTEDTEVTAVYAQTKTVDLSEDNSTTTVTGSLTLRDTRTGEVFTKSYSEEAASGFEVPSNPAVDTIISGLKDSLLSDAKTKAGKYAVTVVKEEVSDPAVSGTVDTKESRTVSPFDPSLTEEYPSIDANGDLFIYTFIEGELSHKWQCEVTLEAKYTSEAPQTVVPAPSLTPEEAAMPTEEKTEELVKKTNTDKKDVAGSGYQRLMLKATSKSKSITLKWKAIKGASGYIIYGAPCGKNMTRLATISNPKTVKKTIKKLKKGKYYKYIVVAYKKTAAGNRIMSKSKSVHCATPGGKKGNPTGIKLKKTKVTLKKGKKTKIKATLLKKGKVATHIAKFRYESSNKQIASVDKKGTVKAKKKGKATIYVYAQNGLCKKVKVTVK